MSFASCSSDDDVAPALSEVVSNPAGGELMTGTGEDFPFLRLFPGMKRLRPSTNGEV